MNTFNKWIKIFQPRELAEVVILCFPQAGGGASAYRQWPEFLTDKMELWAVQLPGREERIKDPYYSNVQEMIKDLFDAVRTHLDKPLILFGHSMGAVLAYEFTLQLKENAMTEPIHLYLAARSAATVSMKQRNFATMSNQELAHMALHKLGTSNMILQHAELRDMFLHTLRTDFRLMESYDATKAEKLQCPVSVFYGNQDENYNEEHYKAWSQVTEGAFSIKAFSGGHQFVKEQPRKLLSTIVKDTYMRRGVK